MDCFFMTLDSLSLFLFAERVLFFCFKYISDEANDSASEDWNNNVSGGGEAFQIYLKNLNG